MRATVECPVSAQLPVFKQHPSKHVLSGSPLRRRPAAASGYSSSGHGGSAGPSLPGCLREFSLRFIYEHHQEMFTTSCVRFYLHHSWQWCWLGELVYSHSRTGCRVGGWEGSAVGICCWVTVGGRDGPVWCWSSITNLICCSHVFIKRLLSEKDEKFDFSYNSDQSPKVSHNVAHNSDCKRT